MRQASIKLSASEIKKLESIISKQDRDAALQFILDVLEAKVKEKELPHCVPFFDAGYNPGQADGFKHGD